MSQVQGKGAPRRAPWTISTAAGLALAGLPLLAGAGAPLRLLSYGAADILGSQANRASSAGRQAVSADGRYVVFATAANNLVAEDSGGFSDVYLADRQTGALARISRRADGGEPNGDSYDAAISADGRWIAYVSQATDIVAAEGEKQSVYLYERDSGQTRLLTPRTSSGGPYAYPETQGVSLSADGGVVVFTSGLDLLPADTDGHYDLYAWTRASGGLRLVSTKADGTPLTGMVYSTSTSISADGRSVGFGMSSVDGTPADEGIFVRDLVSGGLSAVESGGQRVFGPFGTSLSADGRFLAFSTFRSLLPADSNDEKDIYLLDRNSGAFELVSVGPSGQLGDRVSEEPALSADGSRVAFVSAARNFHPGVQTYEVYLRDRSSGTTRLLSLPPNAPPQRDGTYPQPPSISGDGSVVVFGAYAEDLVAGDSNRRYDVFGVRSDGSALARVSQSAQPPRIAGASGAYMRWSPQRVYPIGDSGSVVFASPADNLTAQRQPGVFWHDSTLAYTTDVSLAPLPVYGYPVELHVAGISGDGSKLLLRRTPYDFTGGWGGPPLSAPYDLWLAQSPAYVRVDDPAQLGATASTRDAQLSDDGRYVLFNSQLTSASIPFGVEPRLFRFDGSDGSLRRVDTNTAGVPGDTPLLQRWGMSRNGRFVVFASAANNLAPGDTDSSPDLFLRDLQANSLTRLRHPQTGAPLVVAAGDSLQRMVVSDDGRVVVFADRIEGAGPYTYGLFVLDRDAQSLTDACAASSENIRACVTPSLSADGAELVFASPNALLPQDLNGRSDIYRYARSGGALSLESVDEQGRGGNGDSSWPQLSGSGEVLVFRTESSNWITHPQVTGEGDFLLKRKAGDALFADGFEAGNLAQ